MIVFPHTFHFLHIKIKKLFSFLLTLLNSRIQKMSFVSSLLKIALPKLFYLLNKEFWKMILLLYFLKYNPKILIALFS